MILYAFTKLFFTLSTPKIDQPIPKTLVQVKNQCFITKLIKKINYNFFFYKITRCK